MTAIADFLKKQCKELKQNTLKDEAKNITKNKEFKNLSTSDKDKLLEKQFNDQSENVQL